MASENETVVEIIGNVRSGDYGCAKCGDLCDCPNTDKIIVSIVNRIEDAYQREVVELEHKAHAANFKYLTEKARHSDTYKDARIKAQNDEIATLKREVTELRECLILACKACPVCERMGKCDVNRWRKVLEETKEAENE